MNTKLTLNVSKTVIEHAKAYAKEHQVSLSHLIENYLQSLTKTADKKKKISPLVESLTGVIPEIKDQDVKIAYGEYLSEKYA